MPMFHMDALLEWMHDSLGLVTSYLSQWRWWMMMIVESLITRRCSSSSSSSSSRQDDNVPRHLNYIADYRI